jgi:hypothetical protein
VFLLFSVSSWFSTTSNIDDDNVISPLSPLFSLPLHCTMTNPWTEAAAAPKKDDDIALLGQEAIPLSRTRQQEELFMFTCGLSTLRSAVKLWHVLDGVVGFSLTIYGLSIIPSHLFLPLFLNLGMGVVLLIRSMAGLSGLHSDLMTRCGLRVSGAYLSPVFGLVFFVFSCCCMGNHAVLIEYLNKYHSQLHFLPQFVTWLQQHHHALWVAFLISTLSEGIRWRLVPRLQQMLVDIDTHLDNNIPNTPTSPSKTPWWWQHHHYRNSDRNIDLDDPLLPHHHHHHHHEGEPPWVHAHNNSYSIHDGTSPQQDNSFWSKLFRSPHKTRIDELSFQSVQEEWASKSQEDPFWWSRDEEEEPKREKGKR